MRTKIKFCGLVRAEDLDAAVALGVDLIGFVFYPRSPRVVDVATAAMLRSRLPSYVAAVGLFVNEIPARAAQIARATRLDLLQFHGDESPQLCADIAHRAGGLPWWRALRVGNYDNLLESLAGYAQAEAILLDTPSEAYGGSGEMFDWSLVPSPRACPIVLAGGLTAATVGAGIARLAPLAVDVSSGIQGENPRCKDIGKMERFVAAVLQADSDRARTGGSPTGDP